MDLVPVTEAQARKLEAAGITVHVTYAVDAKLIELVSSLAGKPKRKKSTKPRSPFTHHKVLRVVSTDVTKAQGTSCRGRALRIMARSMAVGDVVDRQHLDKVLVDGGLDTTANPWVVTELLRRGDLAVVPDTRR